jgi:hypothetical protein
MFGYAAPVPPFGGKPWQEVQTPKLPPGESGDPAVWHTWQAGAVETGEVPVTAWQFEQSLSKSACAAPRCKGSRNGIEWFAPPGPLAWQEAATLFAFVKEAEKQEGAAGFGAVRPCVKSWQMLQVVLWFKELRWDGTWPGNVTTGAGDHVVGCALAAVWQVEHLVDATPPSNRMVPGVPWHDWQNPRSLFASRPWKAALVGSVQVEPRMCGVVAAPWHRVLLKHPGGVPAGAGVDG